jgi:hypothetical protein
MKKRTNKNLRYIREDLLRRIFLCSLYNFIKKKHVKWQVKKKGLAVNDNTRLELLNDRYLGRAEQRDLCENDGWESSIFISPLTIDSTKSASNSIKLLLKEFNVTITCKTPHKVVWYTTPVINNTFTTNSDSHLLCFSNKDTLWQFEQELNEIVSYKALKKNHTGNSPYYFDENFLEECCFYHINNFFKIFLIEIIEDGSK